MKEALPCDLYEELLVVVEALPSNSDVVACKPFTGMVFNVGVSTTAHRDPMDLQFCAVLPVGDWKGGELCLYELGLSLQLSSGDLVIFRSDILTHFNLAHTGKRTSFVFSTDKHFRSWVEQGRWQPHIVQ